MWVGESVADEQPPKFTIMRDAQLDQKPSIPATNTFAKPTPGPPPPRPGKWASHVTSGSAYQTLRPPLPVHAAQVSIQTVAPKSAIKDAN